MLKSSSRHKKSGSPPFIFIGCFLGFGYWITEAYFDSLFIEAATFHQRLLPTDSHELWMRSLATVLIVGFGIYVHFAYLRLRSVRSLNVEAGWLLRNAISKTIRGNFPYCVYCKKIRDEDGIWTAPERFIAAQTEAELSGSICDECHSHRSPGDASADDRHG